MNSKRIYAFGILIALISIICFTGCSKNESPSEVTEPTSVVSDITTTASPETPTAEPTTVPTATPTVTPTVAPTATPTLEPTPTPDDTFVYTPGLADWTKALEAFEPFERYENNVDGHHTWNPYVFGYFHEQYHGEEYKQSFFNMIDALIAGEDTFECASADAFEWCIGGRFINLFFPPATDCISYFDGGYENGIGKIVLTLSKEELAERIQEFERMVAEILDDAVSDDYNDFETAFSLFDYISRNWVYDYEEYENKGDNGGFDEDSIFRCFKERKGICWEIADMYEYLLMQCGIEADEVSGSVPGEGHEWTALKLNGKWYMADATWALTDWSTCNLNYFLIDEQERLDDGFSPESLSVAGWYGISYTKYGVTMDTNDFDDLHRLEYFGINRETHSVIGRNWDLEFVAIPYE